MSDTSSPAGGFSPETLAAHGFPTIAYDRLRLGEAFRSDDRLIRPQDIEAYGFMVDDFDPLFFEPGPFGAPVAHPTLLANQALFMRHSRYFVPAGLHARMVFDFHSPAHLGARVRTTGELVDKYVRRDKPYMITAYETRDEHGELLTSGRFTQMLFSGETAPPPGSEPRPEPATAPVDPNITEAMGRRDVIRVGDQLGPRTRLLSQRQIDAYSGVRPGSIHTDEAWAKTKGFRTTVAQGMMSTAYVSALLAEALGEGFVVGGHMDVRFLRPVYQGDRLTASATVEGCTHDATHDPGRIRIHMVVEVTNQDGERTLTGTASGLAAQDDNTVEIG